MSCCTERLKIRFLYLILQTFFFFSFFILLLQSVLNTEITFQFSAAYPDRHFKLALHVDIGLYAEIYSTVYGNLCFHSIYLKVGQVTQGCMQRFTTPTRFSAAYPDRLFKLALQVDIGLYAEIYSRVYGWLFMLPFYLFVGRTGNTYCPDSMTMLAQC